MSKVKFRGSVWSGLFRRYSSSFFPSFLLSFPSPLPSFSFPLLFLFFTAAHFSRWVGSVSPAVTSLEGFLYVQWLFAYDCHDVVVLFCFVCLFCCCCFVLVLLCFVFWGVFVFTVFIYLDVSVSFS